MEAQTRKKIMWISAAVLLGIIILIIGYRWLALRSPPFDMPQVIVCEQMTGEEYDDCQWFLARDRLNPKFCELMQEDIAKNYCLDEINQRLATKFQDSAYCKEILDDQKASACQDAIEERQVTDENCEEYYSEEVCADRLTMTRAIAARNPDVCAAITDVSLFEECLEAVGIGDRDMDGLDEAREEALGTSDTDKDSDDDGLEDATEVFDYETNPADADTDKDGYTDGQEVQSGYNPLGAGRL